MASFPKLPPSGVKVIVVGAGFAGLTAAIECDRKGHSVILLEKVDELKPLGDVISFGQNSTRVFKNWPGVFEALQPIIHKSSHINYISWEGKYVTTQHWDSEWARWGRSINGHRSEIHRIVFEHAKARGIDIRMGQAVTDYFEDDNEAGVEVNAERLTADIVISAEGVRSRGRKIVLGFDEKPQASGYAVFRTWFPADEVAKNEMTKHLVQKGDSHNCWIGQDVHFIAAGVKDGKEVSWVCTHKDDGDIEESWQFPGHVEDVLKVLEGWDPVVLELVKMTPKDRLFDYKLVFRDPLPTFISPKARIALIGDTAHPFLPTSIQGASQAMEDGVTLAACLDVGGKERVTEALRVYEKIRYERVHKIQATGVSTREGWHKADWDVIWKNPQSLHLPRQDWILNFDCETNTYESYEEAKQSLSVLGEPSVVL